MVLLAKMKIVTIGIALVVIVSVAGGVCGCASAEPKSSSSHVSRENETDESVPREKEKSSKRNAISDLDIPWKDAPDIDNETERQWAILMSCVKDSGRDPDTVSVESQITYSQGQITHRYRCIPVPDDEWVKKRLEESHGEISGAEVIRTQSERYVIRLVDGKATIEYLEEKEEPLDNSEDQND